VGSITTFLVAYSSSLYIRTVKLPLMSARGKDDTAPSEKGVKRVGRQTQTLVWITIAGATAMASAWADIVLKATRIIFS